MNNRHIKYFNNSGSGPQAILNLNDGKKLFLGVTVKLSFELSSTFLGNNDHMFDNDPPFC